MKNYGANGEPLPEAAFYILAEATVEEWKTNLRENGGNPKAMIPYPYQYFVSTD